MSGTVAALTTLGGLAKSWLANDAAEDKQRSRVDLAVVEATGQIGRVLSLAFLFGPDVAPLLPWLEAADVAAYKNALADATPAWEAAAKQAAIFGMWGGSERAIRKSHKARAAQRAEAKNAAGDNRPDSGPASGGR